MAQKSSYANQPRDRYKVLSQTACNSVKTAESKKKMNMHIFMSLQELLRCRRSFVISVKTDTRAHCTTDVARACGHTILTEETPFSDRRTTSMNQTLMARLPCLSRTRSWVPMIPYLRHTWSNFCNYGFMLLFSFSTFSDRLSAQKHGLQKSHI